MISNKLRTYTRLRHSWSRHDQDLCDWLALTDEQRHKIMEELFGEFRKAKETTFININEMDNNIKEQQHKIKGLCFKGVLIAKEELKTGTSARGDWKSIRFVCEEYGSEYNRYPQKIQFSAMNKAADDVAATPLNSDVALLFDIAGKEYNGKYYNDLRAWAFQNTSTAETANSTPETAAPADDLSEDLPF